MKSVIHASLFLQVNVSDPEVTERVSLEVEIVAITVDGPPSFEKDDYQFPVDEGVADGTELGDVEVTDNGW